MDQELKPASAGLAEPCLPPALRKPRLRRWEAAEYLRLIHGIEVSDKTLAKWACKGGKWAGHLGGPPFQYINRTPVYPTDALDAWAIEKLGTPMQSTSNRSNHAA